MRAAVRTGLPPNAVRPSATRKTAARRTRRATRRARRAERARWRSTRRLPLGREDGMSRGTLSNCGGSSHQFSARFPWIRAVAELPSLACSRPRPCASRSRAGRSSCSLPLLLLLVWAVAGAVRHVLFLFLVALAHRAAPQPARPWARTGVDPAWAAVALVYLAFAAVVALAILALATVVVQQTRSAAHRVDNYFTVDSGHPPRTGAEQDLSRFQGWLDHHHLSSVHVQREGEKFLNQVGTKDVQKYTTRALRWAEGAGRRGRDAPLRRASSSSSSRSTCCSTCSG